MMREPVIYQEILAEGKQEEALSRLLSVRQIS